MTTPSPDSGTSTRLRRGLFTLLAGVLAITAVAVMLLPGLAQVHAATPRPTTRTEPPSPRSGPRPDPHGRTGGAPQRPAASGAATQDELRRLIDLGQPIYCGGGNEPLVALTFDDGPGILTHLALRQLRRHDAPATFFLVGKLIGEPQFQGIPRQEAAVGAIGDHTWDHVQMTKGSPAEYRRQIARTRQAAQRASGERVQLFRPPFGAHDAKLDAWVRAHGMLEIVWSIDSGDSQGANADKIYRTVKAGLSPGDIILLHDNRGTTESALPRILGLIEARGLTPVTVPQLLTQDPPSAQQVRQHTCP